jgi:hypothetical protein
MNINHEDYEEHEDFFVSLFVLFVSSWLIFRRRQNNWPQASGETV